MVGSGSTVFGGCETHSELGQGIHRRCSGRAGTGTGFGRGFKEDLVGGRHTWQEEHHGIRICDTSWLGNLYRLILLRGFGTGERRMSKNTDEMVEGRREPMTGGDQAGNQ